MSKRSDTERDIVAEIINLVASQVSTGVRVAGEVREKQDQARRQLESSLHTIKEAADVTVRMVRLLDEIEQPLRDAIPVISRAARVLDGILDGLPDDTADQVAEIIPKVRALVDGLAPLAAMGAAMAPRAASPTATKPETAAKATKKVAKTAKKTTSSTTKKVAKKPAKKAANKPAKSRK
ncbi:MAG: hypothetical protein O2986_05185 [Actinomycetota bacterium]|nr:hypothetical protein [Actinomycetota bacterium]